MTNSRSLLGSRYYDKLQVNKLQVNNLKENKIEYLFFVKIHSGQILNNSEIIFNRKLNDKIDFIQFSERPYRIVKEYYNDKAYNEMFNIFNNFSKTLPNCAITTTEANTIIGELEQFKFENDNLIISFKNISKSNISNNYKGNITLFIDSLQGSQSGSSDSNDISNKAIYTWSGDDLIPQNATTRNIQSWNYFLSPSWIPEISSTVALLNGKDAFNKIFNINSDNFAVLIVNPSLDSDGEIQNRLDSGPLNGNSPFSNLLLDWYNSLSQELQEKFTYIPGYSGGFYGFNLICWGDFSAYSGFKLQVGDNNSSITFCDFDKKALEPDYSGRNVNIVATIKINSPPTPTPCECPTIPTDPIPTPTPTPTPYASDVTNFALDQYNTINNQITYQLPAPDSEPTSGYVKYVNGYNNTESGLDNFSGSTSVQVVIRPTVPYPISPPVDTPLDSTIYGNEIGSASNINIQLNYVNAIRIESPPNLMDWGRTVIIYASQIPYGLYSWPSFWLLGDTTRPNYWAAAGEIDIIEGGFITDPETTDYALSQNLTSIHTDCTCTNCNCNSQANNIGGFFNNNNNNGDCSSAGSTSSGNWCGNRGQEKCPGDGCSNLFKSKYSYGKGFADNGGGYFITSLTNISDNYGQLEVIFLASNYDSDSNSILQSISLEEGSFNFQTIKGIVKKYQSQNSTNSSTWLAEYIYSTETLHKDDFTNMRMIINTTFLGAAFQDNDDNRIAPNPTAFYNKVLNSTYIEECEWRINYIKIFNN